jgi:hypothetical protein
MAVQEPLAEEFLSLGEQQQHEQHEKSLPRFDLDFRLMQIIAFQNGKKRKLVSLRRKRKKK